MPTREPGAGARRARAGGAAAGTSRRRLGLPLVGVAIAAVCSGADARPGATPSPDLGQPAESPDLDRLIQRFDATAPRHERTVQLDAWIETAPEPDELVVVLEPEAPFKLVADPGITVTPTEQPGVEWLVPLPYRHVDPETPYFTPPATLRLPFRAAADGPLEILVEYAYCVVDYQCFFGEELLSVAARYD